MMGLGEIPRLFKGAVRYAVAMDAAPKAPKMKSVTPPLEGDKTGPTGSAKKGGKYGLIHTDGTKCDARTPQSCRKYPPDKIVDTRTGKTGTSTTPEEPRQVKTGTTNGKTVNPSKGLHSAESGMAKLVELQALANDPKVKAEIEKTMEAAKATLLTKGQTKAVLALQKYDDNVKALTKKIAESTNDAMKQKLYWQLCDQIAKRTMHAVNLESENKNAVKAAELAANSAKIKAQQSTSAAGGAQTPVVNQVTPLPEKDDYDGWKAHHENLLKTTHAEIDAEFAAGKITEQVRTDKHKAAQKYHDKAIAELDKQKAEADAKANPPKTPPPLPELAPGDDATEEERVAYQKKQHSAELKKLEDEWNSTNGQMSDGSGKGGYLKKLKDLKDANAAEMKKIDEKFHTKPPAPGPEETGIVDPKDVQHTGFVSEDSKAHREQQVAAFNDILKKIGFSGSVHAVDGKLQTTQYTIGGNSLLTNKQYNQLKDYLPEGTVIHSAGGGKYKIIEPNKTIPDVAYSDMMNDDEFVSQAEKMEIPAAIGVDENGKKQMIDIANLPHLLVGGSTGQGKSSVGNAILCSAMETKSPEDLEVDLIDPKQVEYGPYADMPHVRKSVTNGSDADAIGLLQENIDEMKNRNDFFKALSEKHGVTIKDLNGYKKFRAAHPEMNLPNIKRRLVGIEEVANYAQDPKVFAEVTNRIKQLGALARSAGIHLIATTQDPKKETVGDIKANFGSRIAVKSTKQGSINILGESGAEELTGKGDMILKTTDGNKIRIKGAFVNDKVPHDAPADAKSELDQRLESIKAKYPGAGNAQSGASAAPSGAESASGSGTPPEGNQPAGMPPAGGAPEQPKPYEPENPTSEHTLPNSKRPIDISHLGFFAAMARAWTEGAKGNRVTYDPINFNRMGAEKWKQYQDSLNGTAPDYSKHRLSEIHPLPETANEFQRDQFKKWCAKFNEAAKDPDPMKAHKVKKQYLAWIKDEGLSAEGDGKSSLKQNPYMQHV